MPIEIKITYGFTKNKGNYESERLEAGVTCTVIEGEVDKAMLLEYDRVKTFVHRKLGLAPLHDHKDHTPEQQIQHSAEQTTELPARRLRRG